MGKLTPIIRGLKDALESAGRNLDGLPDGVAGKITRISKQTENAVDGLDKTPDGMPHTTVDVKVKEFKQNPKHDSGEYKRQYDEQMDTLQNTSLADWLRNRIDYLENGRTSDSQRAQQDARNDALNKKISELLGEGKSYGDAKQEAAEWLKTQAATHRLDGIAGGNPTDISGVGDTRVNSSLGSQWRSRVGDIDTAVTDFVKRNPDVDLNNTFITITFR
jgi:hypothetical protein